ncbi:MAG TPA: thioredoxin [Thermoanaerobaculia bacterium]|nr:thioredoxin [Thermoanaerobaculia bacterium]
MASEKILTVNQENFQEKVLQSDLPVLIDVWAVWCGPCRVVAPVLEELAEELDGKVKIAKVNVDENQELAMQFRVSSIPTFVLFKGGQAVDATRGAMPKAAFKQFLESHIA